MNITTSTRGDFTGNATLPDGRHSPEPEDRVIGNATFTWVVIAICCAVFLFQLMLGLPDRPVSLGALRFYKVFTLSREGLAHGYTWEFVTSLFLHGNALHILFNMLCLASVGPWVERMLGRWHFLAIFLLGGIAGGLAHILTSAGGLLGASGGVFAVVMALLAYQPRARMWLLLFFVIPIKMKARTLCWSLFIITGFFILLRGVPGLNQFAFSEIGHEAHLGGMLLGLAYVRLFFRHPDEEPFDAPVYPGEVRPRRDPFPASAHVGPRPPVFPQAPSPASVRPRDARGGDPVYEALIDKLEREGLASLSPAELRLLERGTKR